MRILSLNTWGGRAGKEKLLGFLKTFGDTVDVFCLQEVWSAPYEDHESLSAGGRSLKNDEVMVYGMQEIAAALPSHEFFFHPHHLENYGLMMLVRKGLPVSGSGDVFVYKHRGYIPEGDLGNHARNVQYVQIEGESPLTICNFHGLWNGKGKTDSPERIEQSKNILEFVRSLGGTVVLAGDFNLLPDTESLKLIEADGFRNMIREYGVTSTRTSFYTKPEKFADYMLVKNADVQGFEVLPDEVSDHSPLLLDIA